MNINNPGVLDGSVTTAKLANGAVTTAKCSTTDFAPHFTSQLNLNGRVVSYDDQYPGMILSNAASVSHWQLIESTSDGSQQTFQIYDAVNSVDCVEVAPGGSVTLAVPLPEASGGTGAATFLGAGLTQVVAKGKKSGSTAQVTQFTSFTVVTAGYYRTSLAAQCYNNDTAAHTIKLSAGITTIQEPHTPSLPVQSVAASGNIQLSGTVIGYYEANDIILAEASWDAAVSTSVSGLATIERVA